MYAPPFGGYVGAAGAAGAAGAGGAVGIAGAVDPHELTHGELLYDNERLYKMIMDAQDDIRRLMAQNGALKVDNSSVREIALAHAAEDDDRRKLVQRLNAEIDVLKRQLALRESERSLERGRGRRMERERKGSRSRSRSRSYSRRYGDSRVRDTERGGRGRGMERGRRKYRSRSRSRSRSYGRRYGVRDTEGGGHYCAPTTDLIWMPGEKTEGSRGKWCPSYAIYRSCRNRSGCHAVHPLVTVRQIKEYVAQYRKINCMFDTRTTRCTKRANCLYGHINFPDLHVPEVKIFENLVKHILSL